MQTVSIVIPVYFNEGSLPPLFAELVQVERTLLERQLQLELIFVGGELDGLLVPRATREGGERKAVNALLAGVEMGLRF